MLMRHMALSGGLMRRRVLLLVMLVGASVGWASMSASSAHASLPSEVRTGPAEAIPSGLELKGKFNPGGLPTTYYFEYSSDTCDEDPHCSKQTAIEGPLTGDAQQEVPAVGVSGLIPSHGYAYRLVASNAGGTEAGEFVNVMSGAAGEPPSEVPTGAAGEVPTGAGGEVRTGMGGEVPGEPTGGESLTAPIAPLLTAPPIQAPKAKPLTDAQKLARALGACQHDKSKGQQKICERLAYKKYGAAIKRTGKQARKGRK
jgi:hypothetical protein